MVHVADLPPAPEPNRTVNFTIQIDTGKLVDASKEWAMGKLRAKAKAVGEIAVAQSKKRFDDGGDEGVTWPDLWASNDAKVWEAIKNQKDGERFFNSYFAAEIRMAEKNLKSVEKKIDEGKLQGDKARKAKMRATNRLEIAKEIKRTGNPSYRRGGEPLRDTGALKASMNYQTREEKDSVFVEIGPAMFYGRYQQEGFETNGPNFIPFTIKAARKPKGVNPEDFDLLPGVDYVMAWGGVTVPARPFVRFTDQNKKDIESAIAGRV